MYSIEKNTGDLVINGFEQGIAASPHLGIANMQCINLNTEPKEASTTYARIPINQLTITGGTLSHTDSSHVSYVGTVPLQPGSWLFITSGGTTGLTGTYFVLRMTAGNTTAGVFQLSTTYQDSTVVTTVTAGSATFNTSPQSANRAFPVSCTYLQAPDNSESITTEIYSFLQYSPLTYFMLDDYGQIWFYNANYSSGHMPNTPNNWVQMNNNNYTNGIFPTGLTTLGNYLFMFYKNSSDGLNCIAYINIYDILTQALPTRALLGSNSGHTLSQSMNVALSGHDNTIYYTDGPWVGSILPAFSSVYGTWVAVANNDVMTLTLIPTLTYPSVVLVNNMEVQLFSSGTMPSGFSPNTTYYVVDASTVSGGTQTFSLSATVGGSAITPTTTGTGTLSLTAGNFNPSIVTSYNWNMTALQLPAFETSQCLAELGTNLMIGGTSNNIYPWDRSSTTATTPTTSSFFYPLLLPESNTTSMVTVNNMLFIFAGYKGNVYITNGSSVSVALTLPDYVTGQIEPYFIWGPTMYTRMRIWFSVLAPNCGGIWSFVPTLNQLAIGSDVGVQLRLENQNSNGTYNGQATTLLPSQVQEPNGPQYWSGTSDGAGHYTLDGSGTAPQETLGGITYNSPGLLETDAIPTGTLLTKKTFEQVEYKLSTALVSGESVQLYYRQDLGFNANGAWLTCGTVNKEIGAPLSGYFVANFQNTQWLQLRAVLTSTNSSPTFCRVTEIRVR